MKKLSGLYHDDRKIINRLTNIYGGNARVIDFLPGPPEKKNYYDDELPRIERSVSHAIRKIPELKNKNEVS